MTRWLALKPETRCNGVTLQRMTWGEASFVFTCRAVAHCAKVDSWLVSLRMREFLEFVIRQLIEFPDDMVLTEIPSGRTTIFKLQLRRGDVGRVIGRGGQTIQAIRALLASSAARHGERAILEIIE